MQSYARGPHNPEYSDFIEGKTLGEVRSEKDLEVKFSDDIKVTAQCLDAYSSANKMLSLLKWTLRFKNPKVMVTLYESRVRP